jgi:hypothetical protein
MSSATPSGFGAPTSGLGSSLTSGSVLGPQPPATNELGICTTADPQGKLSTAPGTTSNGTKGRVYTESMSSNNQTPAQLAKNQEAIKQALAKPNSGMAGGQSPFKFSSVYGGVKGGGFDVGAEYGTEGLKGSYMGPTGIPGVSAGTEGMAYSLGGDGDVPAVYAGVCIAWRKAPEEKKGFKPKVNFGGGIFQGNTDGSTFCFGLQTPGLPGGGVTVKPVTF